MKKQNPLERPIIHLLLSHENGLSEYELMQLLGQSAFDAFIVDCSEDLALFRKHFVVMNALYQLHPKFWQQGYILSISSLKIGLSELPQTSASEQALSSDAGFVKLSDYYSNWDNFTDTDEAQVNSLLSSFWQRYLAFEEKHNALRLLGLCEPCEWAEIKHSYRRLCQQHHPDKGGDGLMFIEINAAFENLKLIYQDQ